MLVDCPPGVNLPAFRTRMPLSADKTTRYRVDDLRNFALELTAHAGLRTDIARDVAEVLLDAEGITWENTIQIQDGARAAGVQMIRHLLKK